jgi:filamentous hemagglutinin family protein
VRFCALASVSVVPFLAAGNVLAQPVGGAVVAGQAQISSAGAATIINQSSSKAIINWQNFSIAKGASVQFNQPNSAAITLNRVTGGNVSAIDGALRANGQVWLLNPNGLLIGNGAQINVGGLLATTSDIANQDFLGGRYNFSGGGSGAIVNNGTIKTAKGGSVVLSAPSVTNNGVIAARAGHVVLAGTDTFTVDFDGDHLISYAVGASSQTGQVLNSGTVKAAGGSVLMTARAASGVQDGVVNNTGMVEATTARSVNGEIILDAGEGTAVSSGTLDASGTKTGQTGGTVQVLGNQVGIADGARIDVSGDAGGGTVLIGGNFHGQASQQHAQTTIVAKASIKADAITSGNGGKVAVWSDGSTQFAGAVSAQGGSKSGDGGQVETSGHYLQVVDGSSVITAAPFGKVGNWLLDPDFITISNSGTSSPSDSIGAGFGIAFSNSTSSTISPGMISGGLSNTDITLQANSDITVMDGVTVNGTVGYPHTLTLQAGRSIIFNQDAFIINMNANGAVILSANDPGAEFTGGTGSNAVAPGNSGRVPGTSGTPDAFITFNGTGSDSSYIIAAHVDLILHAADAAGVTDGGTIGTATLPANIGPFTPGVGSPTYIQTDGLNAFVGTARADGSNSPTNVSFTFGDGLSTYLNGANLGTTPGSLTVNAAGATQTLPILANSLTLTSNASGASNSFNLSNTGNNVAGFITINTDLPAILADGVTGTLSTVAAKSLSFNDTAGVTLTSSINTVNGISIQSGTGDIAAVGSATLTGTTVDLRSTSGAIGSGTGVILAVSNAVDATTSNKAITLSLQGTSGATPVIGISGTGISAGNGAVTLTATSLSQTAPITAGALTINTPASALSTGAYTLANATNLVTGTFSVVEPTNSTSTGAVNFINSAGLTVGSINTIPVTGSGSAYGAVTLQTLSGDLVLNGSIQGNGITLTTAGNINQNSGAGLFVAPGQELQLTANGQINLTGTANVLAQVIVPTGTGSATSVQTPGLVAISAGGTAVLRLASNARIAAASAVGLLSVTTTGTYTLLNATGGSTVFNNGIDVGSGGIRVTGGALTLNAAGGITQSGRISASGQITLSAAGDITQNTGGTANVSITTSTGLSATSSGGLIRLDDAGQAATSDPGNTIGGFVRFSSAGNTTFYNVGTIITGGPTGTGSSVPGSMTVGGNLNMQSFGATSDIIFNNAIIVNGTGLSTVQAGRNIINYQGHGSLTVRNLGLYAPNGTLGFTDGVVATTAFFLQVVAPSNNTLNLQASSASTGRALIQVNGPLQLGTSFTTGSALSGGPVTITNAQSLTQLSGSSGAITTSGLQILQGFNSATNTTPPDNVTLNNALNAVSGTSAFSVTGNVVFRNSVNTVLGTVGMVSGTSLTSAASVDIEVLGTNSPTLTVAGSANGNSVTASNLVLHATGGIFQSGTGAISANSLTLVSDTGAIGSLTLPLILRANGAVATAQVNNKQIVLSLVPAAGQTAGSITFNQVGSLTGLNAGANGFVDLFGTSVDVFASNITAQNFYFNTHGMEVDSLAAGSFGGQTTGGTIDISSASGANLVIGNTIPGVTTYGLDAGAGSLFLNADGTITQASGAAGLIKAGGAIGIVGLGGVTLNNTLNALTGQIQLASIGSVSFINSVDTHLLTGVSGTTFTLQSLANLYLDQGATVISLASSGDGVVLAAANAFINNSGGVSGSTSLSVANIQASNGTGLPLGILTAGSRFLIYSASPAVDTLGGLTSGNDAIYATTYPTVITASGNRFVFASAAPPGTPTTPTNPTNTLIPSGNLAAAPALNGFVSSITKPQGLPQPAPPPPATELIVALIPPPPPAAQPAPSPLASLAGDSGTAEAPSSSDKTTTYVVSSLDGSSGPVVVIEGVAGGVLIPRFLRATVAPPSGTLSDPTALSGFGNTSLWQ